MSRVAPNRIDRPGTAEEAWDEWAGLKHLPAADPLDWPSVMIVAAHPDDEVPEPAALWQCWPPRRGGPGESAWRC